MADGAGAVAASPIAVEIYASFDALPPPLTQFLAAAGESGFFRGMPWFRAVLAAGGPRTDEPRIYAALCGGRPAAVVIARERKNAGRIKTHMLLSPSRGMYVTLYAPIVDAELGAAGLGAIARAIARAAPRFDVLRFDGLDRHAPETAAFVAALRKAGLLMQIFTNFYPCYSEIAGETIAGYLERLPPEQRTLIETNVNDMAQSGRGRFELVEGGADLKAALLDYALVDVQSPNDPEAYPDCAAEIFRIAAEAGRLRLGLYYVDGEPAAAQAWIVSGGQATIWRTHHANKFFTVFAEAVLTYEMLSLVLDREGVSEIGYGPGYDNLIRGWFTRDCERVGLLVFNPRTAKGLAMAAWHIGGHAFKAAARPPWRLLRRIAGRLR
jgi:hypothetical protein